MNSSPEDAKLPAAFAELEPFAVRWCLRSNKERYEVRSTSSMQELRVFYDAMLPRMEEILHWLDRLPLSELSGEDQRLLRLCFALSEAALAIEVYKEPVLRLAPRPDRFTITPYGMTVD